MRRVLACLRADPNFSYVTRGVTSARPNLGFAFDFDRTGATGGGLNLGTDAAVQLIDQFTISCFFLPQFLTTFDRFLATGTFVCRAICFRHLAGAFIREKM